MNTFVCLSVHPSVGDPLPRTIELGFIPHDFRCGICGIPLRYHRCELRATNHAEYRKFTATTATSFTATYRNRYEYFHCFFCIFRQSYYLTTLFRLKKDNIVEFKDAIIRNFFSIVSSVKGSEYAILPILQSLPKTTFGPFGHSLFTEFIRLIKSI